MRKRLEDRIYSHRARWSSRQLGQFVRAGERVLDVGAGDCQLDGILRQKFGCDVESVDVTDTNRTAHPVTLYDGCKLPYADNSFDTVLLIFVLHHTTDPSAVLAEARRVSRRFVIAFEDINSNIWDRWVFRVFHRWLKWSRNISRPFHEWSPERWSALGRMLKLDEHWRGPLGRQLSYFASRHVGFVWNKPTIAA